MPSYFPEIYEDELLASVIARYHRHARTITVSTENKNLYGSRQHRTQIALPSNLRGLYKSIAPFVDMSLHKLAVSTTLFPYHLAHARQELKDETLRKMLNRSAPSTTPSAGFRNLAKTVQICRDCMNDDMKRYGEPYWHRSHQPEGVHYCWKHCVKLERVDSMYLRNTYASLEHLTINTPSIKALASHSEKTRQLLTEFAQRVHSYLHEPMAAKSEHNFNTLGRVFLLRRYRSLNQQIDKIGLTKDCISYFGEQFLTIMNLPLDARDPCSWFRSMFVTPRFLSERETRKHILVGMFIDNFLAKERGRRTIQEIARRELPSGPWACQNHAADHFGQLVLNDVSKSSSYRFSEALVYRCACGFIFSAHEDAWTVDGQPVRMRVLEYGSIFVKKVRHLRERGFNFAEIARACGTTTRTVQKALAGHLDDASPNGDVESELPIQRAATFSSPRKRSVNHSVRDAELAQRVATIANALYRENPRRRISKSKLMKSARIGNQFIQVWRELYPLTNTALHQHQETPQAFDVRRFRQNPSQT